MTALDDRPDGPVEDWAGGYRSYDLIKEIIVALVVMAVLAVMLALVFGGPQKEAVTFQEWARRDPAGFLATTLDELTGSSDVAGYGPPYTDTADAAQSLFGLSPQTWAGVRIPIDTGEDFVLQPLGRLAPPDTDLADLVSEYRAASPDDRNAWADSYRAALEGAQLQGGSVVIPVGDYGPVDGLMRHMLALAQSGAVDAALVDNLDGRPGFFVFDYTRSQLSLADGDYFAGIGSAEGLGGDQWGMAATLGNWPGQVWLLPVSFWYQIPPGSTSSSGDLIVLAIVSVLALGLVFLPYIPGLRAIPYRLGVYRLIWRTHYQTNK